MLSPANLSNAVGLQKPSDSEGLFWDISTFTVRQSQNSKKLLYVSCFRRIWVCEIWAFFLGSPDLSTSAGFEIWKIWILLRAVMSHKLENSDWDLNSRRIADALFWHISIPSVCQSQNLGKLLYVSHTYLGPRPQDLSFCFGKPGFLTVCRFQNLRF